MGEYVLELENIGKTYSGVNVLRNVNLSLKKGEVHALLGENGAGKSTLIKIISGYHMPDRGGTIRVNGKKTVFKHPKNAIDASIHTIYQELTLCMDMTVAENLVVDKQDQFKGLTLKNKEFKKFAADALERLGQSEIKPDTMVHKLSIAQRQVVEIAKAISAGSKIILMDEPTSSISQQDAERLMQLICKLRDEGVTIVYISHRLHEISEIADRTTVLRDGNHVGTVDIKDSSDNLLINMMVGRDITEVFPKKEVPLGDVVLKLENVTCDGTFSNVSFEVRKGEIFGIGGLVGARRTEVLEAIFGVRRLSKGSMYINGERYFPTNPRKAIRKKIAFVTEDRKKSGLMLNLPVYENLSVVNAQDKKRFALVHWRKMRKLADKQKKSLQIRLNNMNQIIRTLSGGNQQKVALGKWMDFEPDILLFDEPTRGVDIGAKTEIYTIMGELAALGVAIVIVSSELPELISVTDNIMVMQEGKVMGIIESSKATQQVIMSMATQRSPK